MYEPRLLKKVCDHIIDEDKKHAFILIILDNSSRFTMRYPIITKWFSKNPVLFKRPS